MRFRTKSMPVSAAVGAGFSLQCTCHWVAYQISSRDTTIGQLSSGLGGLTGPGSHGLALLAEELYKNRILQRSYQGAVGMADTVIVWPLGVNSWLPGGR